MATISVTKTVLVDANGRSVLHVWTGMGNDDVGEAVDTNDFLDRSVQFQKTFGGATATMEGSNDGVNYHTLNDLQGNALSLTVVGLKGIAEPVRYIRPKTAGGSGTDVDVTLFGNGGIN